ncbi:MAG: efflux RND transporter periplasmic adaptor subunit [Burkholderiaceae bacterium]
MKHRLRWVLVVVLVLVVAGLGAWRLGWFAPPAPQSKGPPPAPVEVATVVEQSIADTLSVTGEFKSRQSVDLRPEVAGRIAEIHFKDGQSVDKGQLLVSLDDRLLKAELAQAKAEAELAASNYNRAQDLFAKKFISARALDESKAAAEVAAAKRDLSQARLDRMVLTAPFAGRVGLRQHSVGDFVKDGDTVAIVEDSSRLMFDFRVPERFMSQVRPGQRLQIELLDQTRSVQAQVEAVDARIDAEGRFIALRAMVDNSKGQIKPGLFGRAKLNLVEREKALVVSEEALVGERSGFFVWRVKDGKAEKVPVQLGIRLEKTVEVLKGLSAGDQVVIAGQLKIRAPGQALRIVPPPGSGNKPAGSKTGEKSADKAAGASPVSKDAKSQ